jgi:hypothetical protein
MSHTPGPWVIDTTTACGPYFIISTSEDVPQIDCIVCSFPQLRRTKREDRPRLEADARLIKAAPVMLHALESLRTYFEEMIEVTESPGTLQTLEVHKSICDRAINEATGKEAS